MNRRIGIVLALVLFMSTTLAAADNQRPNILFFFADDWGRYASAYAALDRRESANSVLKTPNFDRIANSGVLFRNAFVNAPSCTPCRSSLLSGRYFFNTGRGAILQNAIWDPAIPSWPLLLQKSGYVIGKTAKVWSPGTPADAPYGAQKYSYQKSGMRFNNFSGSVTNMMKSGKSLEDARTAILNEVNGNFQDFMKARETDKPFAYWFGTTTTHRKWIQGSGKALWSIDPDSLKGKLPANLPDVPEVREDFADYLGEVQAVDAYLGVLIAELEKSEAMKNTIIVVSGDHGAPGFPGGKCNLYDFGVGVSLMASGPGIAPNRVVDDFVNMMDIAPTLLELGGVVLPEGMNGKSFVNVLQSSKSGQVDTERTWVITGRERHVGGARAGNLPYPHRALRTKDYLYVRNFAPDRTPMGDEGDLEATFDNLANNTYTTFSDMDASPSKAWLVMNRKKPEWKWHYDYAFGKRPAEELYIMAADPDQVKNVAAEPQYAKIREELSARLLKTLKDVGDPRVVEKDCRFERPPFTEVPPNKPKR